MSSASQIIYDIIRQTGPIARIDIHRRFHIRLATITRITERLLKHNLLIPCGHNTAPQGRNPELLQLNTDAFHVIGIHIVCNAFRGGIVSSGGQVKNYSTMEIPSDTDRNGLLKALEKFTAILMKKAVKMDIDIKAVGLALPGEIDIHDGTLIQAAVVLPGLTDIPFRSFLEARFKLPVRVDHDAAAITQAEQLWGKACSCRNFGTLFIGYGIGGRFVIDGRLYRGSRNRAGELGHIPLRHSGPPCPCGLEGCFEALASIRAIEKNYSGGKSFAQIVESAAGGDEKALSVLKTESEYIGEAVAIIFDILDLEMLVINGDIIAAEKIIKDAIIASATAHAHSKQPSGREFLTFSNFGEEVGILGAASGCIKELFTKQGIDI